MKTLRHLRIEDASHVGEARRLALGFCDDLAFGESRGAETAIIVTELATNLVKHSKDGGDLIFSSISEQGMQGLEILSLNAGEGIAHVNQRLRDGCSTACSPATGLGAIRRLSSAFDIYSALGLGAAVLSRVWKHAPAPPPALSVGAVCLPMRGETACGDAWAMKQSRDTTWFLLADGLGHGPDAAIASTAAIRLFNGQPEGRGPAELVGAIHAGLRNTRGAAVAVAELTPGQGRLRFAGLGNISGRMLAGDTSRSLISRNGTAGVEARTIEEFSYPWTVGGLLVLHSDGLAAQWNMGAYPGLQRKDPALIAGVLYRDHQRARDDSVVLVASETSWAGSA